VCPPNIRLIIDGHSSPAYSSDRIRTEHHQTGPQIKPPAVFETLLSRLHHQIYVGAHFHRLDWCLHALEVLHAQDYQGQFHWHDSQGRLTIDTCSAATSDGSNHHRFSADFATHSLKVIMAPILQAWSSPRTKVDTPAIYRAPLTSACPEACVGNTRVTRHSVDSVPGPLQPGTSQS
jgi:hypothetical protein